MPRTIFSAHIAVTAMISVSSLTVAACSGSEVPSDEKTVGAGNGSIAEEVAMVEPSARTITAAPAQPPQYAQCSLCHAVEADAPAKIGPNLNCIVGQTVAASDSFNYSSAFQQAHADGLTWDEETLSLFLKSPKEVVPGNVMPFAGMADEAGRTAIIDYLKATCQAGK